MNLLIFSVLIFAEALSFQEYSDSSEEYLDYGDYEGRYFYFILDNGTTMRVELDPPITSRKGIYPKLVSFTHYLGLKKYGRKIEVYCTNGCLRDFDKAAETVIIVHGFQASGKGGLPDSIRYALSQRPEPFNTIVVDWKILAQGPPTNYRTASNNIKTVGKHIAEMIYFLIQQKVTTLNQITYVGHSLGAQTANFVSENLQTFTLLGEGAKLKRIFAMDPAEPLFTDFWVGDKDRLDKSDGEFVIVVHTNAGRLGFQQPIGHIDFYPNGGFEQPGCTPSVTLVDTCRHGRSYYYLAEAIQRPLAFPARKCKSLKDATEGNCNQEETLFFNWDIMERFIEVQNSEVTKTNGRSPFGMGNHIQQIYEDAMGNQNYIFRK